MKLPVVNRSCGECTACCTACAIAELDKGMNTPCIHQGATGCAIHGNHPASCKEFTCAWLHGDLPERYRPDKCGVIFWIGDQRYLQASLTRADIPVERVTYLVGKLGDARPGAARAGADGRTIAYRDRPVLIIPSSFQLAADPAAAEGVRFKSLGHNLFIASG